MKKKMGRPSLGDKPDCENKDRGCHRQARSHATPLCGACYSSIRYHVKLGPVHVFHWQKLLGLFMARAKSVSTGNIKSLVHKRAAAR